MCCFWSVHEARWVDSLVVDCTSTFVPPLVSRGLLYPLGSLELSAGSLGVFGGMINNEIQRPHAACLFHSAEIPPLFRCFHRVGHGSVRARRTNR